MCVFSDKPGTAKSLLFNNDLTRFPSMLCNVLQNRKQLS